jgi:hypothetical protein
MIMGKVNEGLVDLYLIAIIPNGTHEGYTYIFNYFITSRFVYYCFVPWKERLQSLNQLLELQSTVLLVHHKLGFWEIPSSPV